MARPRKKEFDLKEQLKCLQKAGLRPPPERPSEADNLLDPLPERVRKILGIVQAGPLKATEMTWLIMYDISDDRVRLQIAKYLIRQGCIRIQKSVFIARSENKHFEEVYQTLKEVNEMYDNEDSIILVPVNASDVRSMKLIGKNVNIQAITDPPTTLFF